MLVLWGLCYDGQTTPPYWPWIEVLRSCFQEVEPDRKEAFKGLAFATGIDSENGIGSPHVDRAEQNFNLIDSIVRFLMSVAKDRPILIILENLHVADTSSMQILDVFARRLSGDNVLIVGTYRNLHPNLDRHLLASIGTLSALTNCRHIRLGGLSRGEIHTFLESAKGGVVSDGLVSVVHQKTDGNCLFVKELARLICSEHFVELETLEDAEYWASRIPDRMQPTIMQVVAKVPDSCQHTLIIASLLGDVFDLDVLAATAGLSPGDLIQELSPAIVEGILLTEIDSRCRFVHAVVRDAVAASLTATERSAEHLRIGLALERHFGSAAAEHAVELVDQFRKAGTGEASDHLYKWSAAAGKSAMRVWAWDEAKRYFLLALDSRDDRPADDSVADVWWACSHVCFHDSKESMQYLSAAFEHYYGSGNTEMAVDVAAKSDCLYGLSRTEPNAIAALELKALELVEPSSLAEARILMWYAQSIGIASGEFDEAGRALKRARSIARAHGDTALQARIAAIAGRMCGNWHQYLQHCSEAADLILISQWRSAPTSGVLEFWSDFVACGLLRITQKLAERLVLQAERENLAGFAAKGLYILGIICQLQGNWEKAREHNDAALEVEPLSWTIFPTGGLLFSRALLEAQLGNATSADRYLHEADGILRARAGLNAPKLLTGQAYTVPMLALFTGMSADFSNLKEACEEQTAHMEAKKRADEAPHDMLDYLDYFGAYAALGLISIAENDRDTAQEIFEKIKPVPSNLLYPGNFHLGAFGRLQGMLASLIGRYEEASEYFEKSIDFCRELSLLPELGWTCQSYGEMLSKHGAKETRPKAERLLKEGLDIARDLGMKPLESRITSLLSSRGTLTTVEHPNGLTAREVDVLKGIAQGKTNQEIGYDLNISEHTVDNHVRRILEKMGVSNRVAAATSAVRQGIIELT